MKSYTLESKEIKWLLSANLFLTALVWDMSYLEPSQVYPFPNLSIHSGPLLTQTRLHFLDESRAPLFTWYLPQPSTAFPSNFNTTPPWSSSNDPLQRPWFRSRLDDTQGKKKPYKPIPCRGCFFTMSGTVTALRFYQVLQADEPICHGSLDNGRRHKPPKSKTKDFITHGIVSTLSFCLGNTRVPQNIEKLWATIQARRGTRTSSWEVVLQRTLHCMLLFGLYYVSSGKIPCWRSFYLLNMIRCGYFRNILKGLRNLQFCNRFLHRRRNL